MQASQTDGTACGTSSKRSSQVSIENNESCTTNLCFKRWSYMQAQCETCQSLISRKALARGQSSCDSQA